MKRSPLLLVSLSISFFLLIIIFTQCKSTKSSTRHSADISGNPNTFDASINANANDMLEKGKAVFRFETFGDEVFWTDKLQLQKAIADEKHGGSGKGLTPKDALAAGLKVDLNILPHFLKQKIKEGKFLDDPWVTLQLLKINAELA
jgi:hypothetical protein